MEDAPCKHGGYTREGIVISVTRKSKNSLEIQHYFHCVYSRRRLELQTNQ
jgi:hypothetical protein